MFSAHAKMTTNRAVSMGLPWLKHPESFLKVILRYVTEKIGLSEQKVVQSPRQDSTSNGLLHLL